MAFHSYPQLIQAVFNQHWFGPPYGVTRTSSWPRVDHLASRLFPATSARFGLAFASARLRLTSPLRITSRLIMQKARGQAFRTEVRHSPPTACRYTVSGTISLPSQGFFSPFPHGTGSLSVSKKYLALRDGPRGFSRDFSCPAILRNLSRASHLSFTGLSPSMADRSRSFN